MRHDPALLAEALLWVEWAREAGGGLLPADESGVGWSEVFDNKCVTTNPASPGEGLSAARAAGPARNQAASARAAPPQAAGQAGSGGRVLGRRRAGLGLSPEERTRRLAALAEEIAGCARCALAATRQQTVFGEGSPTPRLVIVGEAPGADEDRSGRPFVGRAGQLLTKMLAAIGLSRDDVFICNILKCRPPQNRSPRPDEVGACRPFLREQLELLEPPLILALGSPAVRELLRTERGITSLRGRFARTPDGHRVMPTFHPAYLLRNPAAKRDAWDDLQKVAVELGLTLPPR